MLKIKHILELNIEELLTILGGRMPLSSFFETSTILPQSLSSVICNYGDDERLMESALLRLALVCAAVKSKTFSGHNIDVYYERLHDRTYLVNELKMFAHMGSGITKHSHIRSRNGHITGFGVIDKSKVKNGTEVTVLCSDNTTVSIPRNLFDTYCCYG